MIRWIRPVNRNTGMSRGEIRGSRTVVDGGWKDGFHFTIFVPYSYMNIAGKFPRTTGPDIHECSIAPRMAHHSAHRSPAKKGILPRGKSQRRVPAGERDSPTQCSQSVPLERCSPRAKSRRNRSSTPALSLLFRSMSKACTARGQEAEKESCREREAGVGEVGETTIWRVQKAQN